MSELVIENLKKTFKKRTVVQDVSLTIKSGEIVGLLGPNGAGKTTSFYMIVGLIPTDRGRISLDDVNLSKMPIHSVHSLVDCSSNSEQSVQVRKSTSDLAYPLPFR
ncbi:MAG: ATP-binding cassette domain-containing protein [Actinobacteria bacterium]|nr:ATP-binding cassette domain-containing protein [Actinomycetota bacterium]